MGLYPSSARRASRTANARPATRSPSGGSSKMRTGVPLSSSMVVTTVPRKPCVENEAWGSSPRSFRAVTNAAMLDSCQKARITWSRVTGPTTRQVRATSRRYSAMPAPTRRASHAKRTGATVPPGAGRAPAIGLKVPLAGLLGDLVQDRLDLLSSIARAHQERIGGVHDDHVAQADRHHQALVAVNEDPLRPAVEMAPARDQA